MRRTFQRMLALVATSLVGCSLFIDTSGFDTDDALASDAQPDTSDDGGPSFDGGPDRIAPIDAPADSPPPADVLVDGPVDASVCPTPPNDPSLKGWYLFDEGTGSTVIDCSTSQRHGVQANGAWAVGKKGGGLSFNGTSTCVTLPAGLALASGFTLAAWVNVASFNYSDNNSRYILGKTNDGDKGWILKVDAPPHYELTLGQGSSRVDLATAGTQAANVWTHVVAVYVPSTRSEIWINGSMAISGTPPASFVDDPAAPARIGCRNDSHVFSGIIDEVRIYDRALSAAEIASLAQ